MSRARILVIDDEPISLKVLINQLQTADFEVLDVDGGEKAWDLLNRDANFDVIILDRLMPGLDGMSLFNRLQADDQFKAIPIIMLTAVDDGDEIIEAISAGVFDYLTKPVDGKRLLDLIDAAVSRA